MGARHSMVTTWKLDRLQVDLADNRSRRVVFVSHCLLNENVRYLGGAGQSGSVSDVLNRYLDAGVGIYQMPCPEQLAWGGVLKRYLLPMYGARGSVRYRLRGPLTWVFLSYSRFVYARLARRIVRDIADYVRSGFEVEGIVGVGASPSCGVLQTLDLSRSMEVIADCRPGSIDAAGFNARLMGSAITEGPGGFIRAMRSRIERRHLNIPFTEHNLLAELRDNALLRTTPDESSNEEAAETQIAPAVSVSNAPGSIEANQRDG